MYSCLFLKQVRVIALRKRIWYSVLNQLERGILSLAAQLTKSVKSDLLCIELTKILDKLTKAMKNKLVICIESYGLNKAKSLASLAMSFGYSSASSWITDMNFVKFLAFMKLNALPGWRIQ